MQPEPIPTPEPVRDHGPDTTKPGPAIPGGRLLTNSRMTTQRRCSREQRYRYELGFIPLFDDEGPKRFGTIGHYCEEAWWGALRDGTDPLAAVMAVLDRYLLDGADPFEIAGVRAVMLGYHARYIDEAEKYDVLGVELELTPTPILNPVTGKESRTWLIGGKLDLYLRERATGRKLVGEHKFTSEDITTGSNYFKRLKLDSQVSVYTTATDAEAVLYDVIARPMQRPSKATPLEAREYTKPKYKQCPLCKKKGSPPAPHAVLPREDSTDTVRCEEDPEGGPRRICTDPGGKLYANLREFDETPEEFFQRIADAIATNPDAWYARAEVVRLDSEIVEHQADTWALARIIRENQLAQRWPRNPEACIRYGRTCSYWGVCVGEASLDDGSLFERRESGHAELTVKH